MAEELYYLDINNKRLFFHEHVPDNVKGVPVLFLNPLFDEKKRSQKFYADTAREFCKYGTPVIRFDYYGTGDSEGELFEMDIPECLKTAHFILEKLTAKYKTNKINLLGLRFGGDLALEVALHNKQYIDQLIIIEPIVNGKRYLTEQRSRRKIFQKLNNMNATSDSIVINGNRFEDHQGYPISESNLHYIENLNTLDTTITDTTILLVKLHTISSRKTITQLSENLKEKNNISLINFACNDFWANLEPIDTLEPSKEIVNKTVLSYKL